MDMEVVMVVVVVAEAEGGEEEAEAEAEDVLTCHERQRLEEMRHAERERRAQRTQGQAAGPDGIAMPMLQALPVGRECTREKEINIKVSLRIKKKKKQMNEPRTALSDRQRDQQKGRRLAMHVWRGRQGRQGKTMRGQEKKSQRGANMNKQCTRLTWGQAQP
jgi:hypothetical protein